VCATFESIVEGTRTGLDDRHHAPRIGAAATKRYAATTIILSVGMYLIMCFLFGWFRCFQIACLLGLKPTGAHKQLLYGFEANPFIAVYSHRFF
jgi:hypothetical protein